MLYDSDCGFCLHWIEKWKKMTGDEIEYKPCREAGQNFPQVSEKDCQEAVQLIIPEGSILSGAHAVFKSLSLAGKYRSLDWLYDRLPIFGRITELIYQWVAHHRLFLSRFFSQSIKKCG